MNLKTILGVTLLAVSPVTAAVTITLTENPTTGAQFQTSAGSPVLDGRLIRIGTFASDPLVGATFDTLSTAFSEFGTTTMGHASNVNSGRVNKASIAGSTLVPVDIPDSFFVGKKIYIWVYNAATADTLADQGIFSTSDATITFKDQGTAFSVSMTKMDQAFGTFTPGTAATSTVVLNTAGGILKLGAAVPEPSSVFLLFGLSTLAFVRRRRGQ